MSQTPFTSQSKSSQNVDQYLAKKPNSKFKRSLIWAWKEILFPLGTALVVIVFLIQAFKIPSQSMEGSLLVGDFLVGLKFPYGTEIPFTNKKIPGFTDPKVGDVLIFKYPGEPQIPDYNAKRYTHIANLLLLGNYYWDKTPDAGQPHLVHNMMGPKDFIKRCVAQSGQTVQIKGGKVWIDGVEQKFPEHGQFTASVRENSNKDFIDAFEVPAPGDHYRLDTLSLKKIYDLKSLILQENPNSEVVLKLDLIENGRLNNDYEFKNFRAPYYNHKIYLINEIARRSSHLYNNPQMGDTIAGVLPFAFYKELAFTGFIEEKTERKMLELGYFNAKRFNENNTAGWKREVNYDYFDASQLVDLDENVKKVNKEDSTAKLQVNATLLIDGKPIQDYTIKNKAYFMMGDNRDNSMDSRYWGFVSRENVKAKAFMIYMSIEDGESSSYPRLSNPLSWPLVLAHVRWNRIGKLIR